MKLPKHTERSETILARDANRGFPAEVMQRVGALALMSWHGGLPIQVHFFTSNSCLRSMAPTMSSPTRALGSAFANLSAERWSGDEARQEALTSPDTSSATSQRKVINIPDRR
jgi:hypothetical protein